MLDIPDIHIYISNSSYDTAVLEKGETNGTESRLQKQIHINMVN